MSENGKVEAAAASPEVQAAYDQLVTAFVAFGQAMQAADALGIDAQAVIAQQMTALMSPEDLAGLPPHVRMLLG